MRLARLARKAEPEEKVATSNLAARSSRSNPLQTAASSSTTAMYSDAWFTWEDRLAKYCSAGYETLVAHARISSVGAGSALHAEIGVPDGRQVAGCGAQIPIFASARTGQSRNRQVGARAGGRAAQYLSGTKRRRRSTV